MTDTEHGFEPKWTPGPWTASYNGIFMGGGGEFALGSPNVMSGRYRRKVDVELASLAPELAAAVLDQFSDVCHCDPDEWDEGGEGCLTFQCINTCVKTEQRLRDVYWRLRMIGADDAGKCYCDTDDSSRCDGTCTRMIGADE